ncbi:hypothetical protein PIB30_080950 [Stylosanthes scabra]|uniref:Uncharacterized protein n=1 Tax=Stylosanthes scabra TaxID=79078 RepID=A0ABU6QS62_9FABA|nr:hypothetical protein [Stylosanthes scabra]
MYALALKGKISLDLLIVLSSSFIHKVKAQRAPLFEQEEANSEEGASEKSFEKEIVEENSEEEIQDNMADNANNQRRTLANYTNPTATSCGSSNVWPTVDANNFELKPALV